jgi:hypothetical protein
VPTYEPHNTLRIPLRVRPIELARDGHNTLTSKHALGGGGLGRAFRAVSGAAAPIPSTTAISTTTTADTTLVRSFHG